MPKKTFQAPVYLSCGRSSLQEIKGLGVLSLASYSVSSPVLGFEVPGDMDCDFALFWGLWPEQKGDRNLPLVVFTASGRFIRAYAGPAGQGAWSSAM